MRLRPFLSLGVLSVSVAMVAGVYAQAAKSPAAPTASQNGNIIIRNSPQGTGVYDDTTGIAQLTKDVTVVQTGEDFILYAQDLTYNKPKNQAVATGSLRVETRDSTIRGERIFADFNKKIITITRNVVITTHGKGDGITGTTRGFKPEYARKPSKITCDRADWDYEDRQAILTGNLRMSQEKNSGTCERIEYDEEQNVANLKGKVRFRTDKNQVFDTPDLKIFIDEGKIKADHAIVTSPGPSPTPRPTKKPRELAPTIPNDIVKQFDMTPQPIPTTRPEPMEAPAEATEAPVTAPE